MIEFAGTDIILETPKPLGRIRSAVSAALGVSDSRVAVIEDIAHYPEPDSADDLLETRAIVPVHENNPYTMWLLAPLSPPRSASLDTDASDEERYILAQPGRLLDAAPPSRSGPDAIVEELFTAPGAARDRLRVIDDGAVLVAALRVATNDTARQILCDVLGFRREPYAVDALIEALASSSPKVRSAAADALAKIADRRGPRALRPPPAPGSRPWRAPHARRVPRRRPPPRGDPAPDLAPHRPRRQPSRQRRLVPRRSAGD